MNKMKGKKYHVVRRVPKYNKKNCKKEAKLIPLTHKYMTVPVLVQVLL
jgi:hypothetical protein